MLVMWPDVVGGSDETAGRPAGGAALALALTASRNAQRKSVIYEFIF